MGREHALYAVDLEDAVNAAVEMARKRAAASCKFALWIFLFQEVQKHTTDDPRQLGAIVMRARRIANGRTPNCTL